MFIGSTNGHTCWILLFKKALCMVRGISTISFSSDYLAWASQLQVPGIILSSGYCHFKISLTDISDVEHALMPPDCILVYFCCFTCKALRLPPTRECKLIINKKWCYKKYLSSHLQILSSHIYTSLYWEDMMTTRDQEYNINVIIMWQNTCWCTSLCTMCQKC